MVYARISLPQDFMTGLLITENTVTLIPPPHPDGSPAISAPLLKDRTIAVTREQLQGLRSGEMGLGGLDGRVVSIEHIAEILHTSPECAADTLRACFGSAQEGLRKSMVQAAAAYYRHAHDTVQRVERDLTLYNTPPQAFTEPLLLPPLNGSSRGAAQTSYSLAPHLRNILVAILKHGDCQVEILKASLLKTSKPPYDPHPLPDGNLSTYTIPAHIGQGLINTETLQRYVAWAHGSPVSIPSLEEATALYLLARSLMNPRLTAALLPYCKGALQKRADNWLPTPDEVNQRLDATNMWQEVGPLAERYIQQLEQQARFLARAHHLQGGESTPVASAASAEWVAGNAAAEPRMDEV